MKMEKRRRQTRLFFVFCREHLFATWLQQLLCIFAADKELMYDIDNQVVRIPNEEVKTEFVSLFKNRDNSRMSKLIKKSEKILEEMSI